MSVRVLIAEKDPALRGEIRDMMGLFGDCEVVALARDGQEAIQMTMQLVPHVALISADLPGMSGLQACETIGALAPDVMSIIVTESGRKENVDAAMRAGARAVISPPLTPSQLSAIVEELAEIRARMQSPEVTDWRDPSRFPKVVSVTGAKGGVGKSTIAVNLAVTLAKRLHNKVIILDLYTQFGDVPTMLNMTPKHTVAEMASMSGEIDTDLIKDYVTKHQSGVHVLSTSLKPLPLDVLSAEYLDELLHALKRIYRYVIIDVPPILHPTTLHAMSHSNVILLIANLFDLTTATDTKKIFEALQSEHISKDNIKVVLNRVLKANRLRVADVEKMLDCSVVAQIPNDRRLVSSVNNGIPLVMQDPESPVGRSFAALADVVSGTEVYVSGTKGSTGRKRIFAGK